MKIKITQSKKTNKKISEKPTEIVSQSEKWFESEGQLAVDVYQTEKNFYVQTPVAGVKPEDLDISFNNDMLTIKGKRERLKEFDFPEKDYFYQECYWGKFSRQIILPSPVDGSRIEASIREGILTIKLPKIKEEKTKKIKVKDGNKEK